MGPRGKNRVFEKNLKLGVVAVFFSTRILRWGLPLPHKSVVTQLSKTLKIMKVYYVSSKSKKISSESDIWFWNGGDFSKSLIFSKYWIMDLTCCCPQRLNWNSKEVKSLWNINLHLKSFIAFYEIFMKFCWNWSYLKNCDNDKALFSFFLK